MVDIVVKVVCCVIFGIAGFVVLFGPGLPSLQELIGTLLILLAGSYMQSILEIVQDRFKARKLNK